VTRKKTFESELSSVTMSSLEIFSLSKASFARWENHLYSSNQWRI